MARAISGINLAKGFEGEKLIVTGAKAKREYKDGKATDEIEAVRVEVVGANVSNIHLDLTPYTEDKLQRAQALFGQIISIENLVSLTDVKIGIYNDQLSISVTATDIKVPGKG